MKRNELIEFVIWFIAHLLSEIVTLVSAVIMLVAATSTKCDQIDVLYSITVFSLVGIAMLLLQYFGEERGYIKAEL